MKLPTNLKLGIIGGGQLGKMLIEASRPWNIYNTVLEANPDCPASTVADEVVTGSLMDADKIRQLAAVCDVLTFEIEHINAEALREIEQQGKKVIPSAAVLELLQDKGLQKEFYSQHEIPTANYVLCHSAEEMITKTDRFAGSRVVVKHRKGGYDGKGVEIVKKEDIHTGRYVCSVPSVMEEFCENMTEYSVIVAADQFGNITSYPLIEMYFNPSSNLVEFLFSPAEVTEDLADECRKTALKAIKALNSPGLFAVELFVDSEARVLVNEIAPRPHNSGHHTIEGSYTSQFEQLNRILLGLPLGSTDMLKPAAMINLVGAENQYGKYHLKHANKLLEIPGVYIHLYNKKEIKPNRKMGHLTVLAESFQELMDKASRVKEFTAFETK
jgi:5-(carboxyamino)imidazole ribonucleotide synthase